MRKLLLYKLLLWTGNKLFKSCSIHHRDESPHDVVAIHFANNDEVLAMSGLECQADYMHRARLQHARLQNVENQASIEKTKSDFHHHWMAGRSVGEAWQDRAAANRKDDEFFEQSLAIECEKMQKNAREKHLSRATALERAALNIIAQQDGNPA